MTGKELENVNVVDSAKWVNRTCSTLRRIDETIRFLDRIKNALENDLDVLVSKKEGETNLEVYRESTMVMTMIDRMRDTTFDLCEYIFK